MPPEVKKIPLPSDFERGPAAADFLAAHGLVSRVPTLRSSDYEMCLGDPHLYYLTRRLGLCRKLSFSKAVSRGSWFHKAWETEGLTGEFERVLSERLTELKVACASMGIVGDTAREMVEDERRAAATGKASYEGSKLVKVSDRVGTWEDLLLNPRLFRVLGKEMILTYRDPDFPQVLMVAQLDGLLHQIHQNTLWIVDFKTVDGDATARLQTCPIEFQTQTYIHVTRQLLMGGGLREKLGLPDDVRMGGMIHVAVSVPSISFGMMDRDYRFVEFTPKTGKNKGITRQEKEYLGEPKFENYLKRVRHWYNSSGDYEGMKAQREAEPLVNLSWTTPDCLDGDNFAEYRGRVQFVVDHATRDAYPANFLRSSDVRRYGRISDWAPFSLLPVRKWPEIIQKDGFMVQFRDEELMS